VSAEWPHKTLDLIPSDFLLWHYLKDALYRKKKASQNFRITDKKVNGLGQPSQQQLWWLLVRRLLIAAKNATELTVVILHTCTTFANTTNASADTLNVFIPLTEFLYIISFFFLKTPVFIAVF